jgi:hypothetical protein
MLCRNDMPVEFEDTMHDAEQFIRSRTARWIAALEACSVVNGSAGMFYHSR